MMQAILRVVGGRAPSYEHPPIAHTAFRAKTTRGFSAYANAYTHLRQSRRIAAHIVICIHAGARRSNNSKPRTVLAAAVRHSPNTDAAALPQPAHGRRQSPPPTRCTSFFLHRNGSWQRRRVFNIWRAAALGWPRAGP